MDKPTRLGKYNLQRKLAVGGMAEIWLAEQQGPAGFAKTLVVKQILGHLADDAKFVEMFLDEARLAARLEHPNIVRITDLGEADGKFFLAMEYIDGPDLDYMIERAAQIGVQIPFQIAARIMADALAGLDYAHNFADVGGAPMGLVHRDISPHNILVNAAGVAKIVDFGVAKAASSTHKTQTGAIKGKFAYMSPEQISNNTLDGRSDVFAMGIVLYELTTNHRPFGDGEDLLAVTQILMHPPKDVREFVRDYPPEMESIIHKALAKDRDERYESARAMQQDLERWLHTAGHFVTQADVGDFIKDLFSENPKMLEGSGQVAPPPPRYEADRGDAPDPGPAPPSGPPTPNTTRPEPPVRNATPPEGIDAPMAAPPAPPPPEPVPSGSSGTKTMLIFAVVGLVVFILAVGGVIAAVMLPGDKDDPNKGKGNKGTASKTDKDNDKDGKSNKGGDSSDKKGDKDEKDSKASKKKRAKVIFDSQPPTIVSIKGEDAKKRTPTSYVLEEGTYSVTFEDKDNGISKKVEVKVTGDKRVQEHIELFAKGTLRFDLDPKDDEYIVQIDNKTYPKATSTPLELWSGKHKVTVKNTKTGKYKEKTVTVKADEEAVFKASLN